jgi:hypothetical protein
MISRRKIFDYVSLALGSSACVRGQAAGSGRDANTHDPKDFAIFPLYGPAIIGWAPQAYSQNGSVLGTVTLNGLTDVLSVSLDAESIAWVPEQSMPYPRGPRKSESDGAGQLLISRGQAEQAVRVRQLIARVAISGDKPGRIAVLHKPMPPGPYRLALIDEATGSVEGVPSHSFTARGLRRTRLCNDGQLLLVSYSHEFSILDLMNSEMVLRLPGTTPSLSPDGKTVAYIRPDGTRWLIDLKSGKSDAIADARIDGFGGWSPDRSSLLVSLTTNGVRELGVCDMATLKTRRIMPIDEWPADFFVWLHPKFISSNPNACSR